jgi:hypothetical protein
MLHACCLGLVTSPSLWSRSLQMEFPPLQGCNLTLYMPTQQLQLIYLLFIYSSYSLATVRLWWRLHILITKLVLQLLPQVPTGICPGAVIRFGGVVPHCYLCVCSISHLLFLEPCLLGGHLAGLSSISSSLPLLCLVLFPTFVSSTVHNSI